MAGWQRALLWGGLLPGRGLTGSRTPEQVMTPDAAPYDVRAPALRRAILEGGAPIGRPRHLEDAVGPFNALHPQPATERTGREVRVELAKGRAEPIAIRIVERLPVALETPGALVR